MTKNAITQVPSLMQQAWRTYRLATAPQLRRPAPVGIVRNGGVRRVYECACCGAQVSMDARWPITVRVSAFMAEHNTVEHIYHAVARRTRVTGLAPVAVAVLS